jgi:hypothetical protein
MVWGAAEADHMPSQDPGGDTAGRDRHLTFLTEAQASRVRMLVRQAFAERGREVEVFAGHVRDDHGAEFGLWNVAVSCRDEPEGERAWPRVVARHVESVIAAADTADVFAGLSAEEVRSRTYAKLWPVTAFPQRGRFRYMREIAPGLLDSLVLDLPDSVAGISDSEVERFGGLDGLREAGLANLRALPVEERQRMDAPDGGNFEVLLGQSVYTASRVLVMPDLLRQMLGPVDAGYGVLAAMANRHQVALHVIRDRSVLPSISHLARFAVLGYSGSLGRLSPDVYWWRDGAWQRISEADGKGAVRVHVSAELGRVLDEVGCEY